ncbi:hypothetical protein C6P40_000863 [Pichia californica]|uniref:Zinc finger C2H2 LYAR-type domain-containing protein n=1 Tax=Pichia californica TaxID=460514 RepID=A0A9P6WJW8_9ASCO|nr:hypothetical protein C6P42_000550 [[Candida] californica]KAG0688515.1 hypothetical protein C6P40_000863 [[Candida] californica]
MVSFSCEVCNDTVIKKKLQQHQRSCHGSYFTCIDCSTTFYGNDHQKHTSCISEAEKYEKGLFKGKKSKNNNQPQIQYKKPQPKPEETKPEVKKEIKSESNKKSKKESKNEPKDFSKYVDSKETTLYKIFKSIKKDNKNLSDKTHFLKNVKLTQNKDGSFNLSL